MTSRYEKTSGISKIFIQYDVVYMKKKINVMKAIFTDNKALRNALWRDAPSNTIQVSFYYKSKSFSTNVIEFKLILLFKQTNREWKALK